MSQHNKTFEGVPTENVTEVGYGQLNFTAPGLETQELMQRLGTQFGQTAIGSRPLTGIILLGALTAGLYSNEASLDASTAVLVPAVFILGSTGFLPYSQGIISGMLLALAALVTAGIARFIL